MLRAASVLLALVVGGCASPATTAPPRDMGKGADLLGGGGRDLLVAVPDLLPVPDLADGRDLAPPPDQSSPLPDLATAPPDLSRPPDLSMPPPCDKAACQAACIAQCILMMKIGIGVCTNGACTCVCV